MALNPKIRGDYGRHPRGSNDQGGPRGISEDRVLDRGGQSPLGNALARNVGLGGPGTGREVSKSGSQDQYGPSAGEYQNPAMDDLDRYYGYGRGREKP